MTAATPSLLAVLLVLSATAARAGDDYAQRMEHEHHGEAPVASPATVPEPRQPVSAADVVYAHLGDTEVHGYLARPEGVAGPLPGLIVIQEWWGLNDNVRAVARRLAGEGYVALAVDLYEGRVATDSDQAYATMSKAMEKPDRLLDNLRQAHAYLKREAGATRIGVVGWCFGGGWSLQTALDRGDGIAAAVMYYGRPVLDDAELAKLKAPLLGLFGGLDHGIPVDSVRDMESRLKKLGKDVTIVVYADADHAFANPSGTRYNAKDADDAWQRTTAFLADHLKR
jgi:carboxymethylenebutenolidase